MKKYLVVGIVLAVIAALIGGVFIALACLHKKLFDESGIDTTTPQGTLEYYEPEGELPYLQKRLPDGTISDGALKIVTFTDLHLLTEKAELTFAVMERFLEREQPDLVVLLGDNTTDATKQMQTKLSALFESRKQYWAFILGNHDSEAISDDDPMVCRNWAFDALAGSKYCLARKGDEDVWGVGNYAINVKNSSGAVIHTLVFLDSGSMTNEAQCQKDNIPYKYGYDYIKSSQIEWYKETLNGVKAQNAGVMPKSSLFIHIPLYEYREAYEFIGKKNGSELIYGAKVEDICSADVTTGMFDAILELGSTTAVYAGHDHVNDFCVLYKGVRLLYSQSLSYDSYNSRGSYPWLKIAYTLDKKACYYSDGCTLTMVRASGQTDIVPRLTEYTEGIFDGLDEELAKADIKI